MSPPRSVSRHLFLLWCVRALELRIPYVWGGKNVAGLDCSGFVTVPLWMLSAGAIDLRATHNTDRLWAHFPRIAHGSEQPGDVAVYRGANSIGPEDVEHVMVYLGNGIVVGQAIGGRANVDRSYSEGRGHWTKAMPLHYRPDCCGFVRLPLADQP